MTIKVTIEGEFKLVELVSLVAFMRRELDRDRRHWSVFIEDTAKGDTLKEAEALLRKIMPEVPGRETTFAVHRKQ